MNAPIKYAALQTQTLFISAGHSDKDPGAVGNGYTEAQIVLEFRDKLADYLRDKVFFGKDGQRGENLPLTVAANEAAAHDVAVEFHCNAFSSPTATGVETLSAGHHYPLGNALCAAISSTLGIANRGAKGEASGQHSRLAFINRGNGIIVELFFITNPSDLASYFENIDACVKAVGDELVSAVCVGLAA
ncbi:N-acetylmuramoyl-L-alanine amidase [Vreelandella nanhaiensis]|uniref:N-acetylmuramoyl-L-alanine amidase n=1 Tax=Vreelandella nanhaiensis TaxID=1258546 RepID=UPI00163D124B|nr:N-acetylmuramoyl-L-alanine amidase [Halomonas nanhaiensis]